MLVDNNLSPLLAKAIDILVAPDGHRVVALRESFPANTKDAEWIEALGREGGWTVLSGDIRITRRPAERLAWHRSRLKGFFLAPGWSKMTNIEKTAKLLLWWPKLVAQELLVGPGAVFQVPVNPGSRLSQLPIP
jgi:PIN like domain